MKKKQRIQNTYNHLDSTFSTLNKRLETIKSLLKQEVSMQRIVKLEVMMENMLDELRTIRLEMLTKWDVVKIVFAVISILVVLLGLGLSIIYYLI
jgi:hypothetical protein